MEGEGRVVNSNSIAIVDREIVSGSIEGVDFGPRLWVIARSPTAVLAWIYGHSWSNNGHSHYAQPHLLILPDRTPTFMHNPRYILLTHEWTRLTDWRLDEFAKRIEDSFPSPLQALEYIKKSVREKRTVIFDGGGGSLLPAKCYGEAHRDWQAQGNGFIVFPEGANRHQFYRHKLGWKPQA
jgi:hypothetical protein